MRLLEYNSEGDIVLTKDLEDDGTLPQYGILSHTWKEGQEVTFDDLKNETGKNKSGYHKIQFCGQQAKEDGLQYFWVDTCCIDKSNQAELQHSLRSMFRWYQNATHCYVYLSDVSMTKRKAYEDDTESTWEPAFRVSRWFTRGWTLQELLAPSSVKFFSVDETKLGDKTSLRHQIHRITAIPLQAVQNTPLTTFSVEQRFQWRRNRHTTFEEDGAYSLLGIFGVDIAPIYGEGAAEAFRRLRDEISKLDQCIQDLYLTDPRDDKKRIEETKGGLLEDASHWILSTSEYQEWYNGQHNRLLWIRGDPGKGKTMLLCSIADKLKQSMTKTDLLSYFFCQATDPRINTATAVLRGLLYMILEQQPSLAYHVRKKYDRAGRKLFEDANAWISLTEFFTSVLEDPLLNNTYLLIDALDECNTDLPKLLDFIARSSSVSSHVKWIISSRNWPEIENRLARADLKIGLSLELNTQSISAGVNLFIRHKVAQLAERKQYDDQTRHAVLQYLCENSQDTFLWVALVVQNLDEVARRNVITKLHAIPSGLNALYKRMLDQISTSDDASLCKQVLAFAATVYRPVTIHELSALVEQLNDLAAEEVLEIIKLCGSFLTLRGDTVYFVHQSAKDYISTEASPDIFPSGKEGFHGVILSRTLHILSPLHRDMLDLGDPGYDIDDVARPDPDPLAAFRYSGIYWVDHLCEWDRISATDSGTSLITSSAVGTFLQEKFLYWLEFLSLDRSMSKGVMAMTNLADLVQRTTNMSLLMLSDLIHDAYRFIRFHKSVIESYPLQTYASALLFSPTQSLIRRSFQDEAPVWVDIKPDMEDGWSSCLQTLEHTDMVHSVAFSHDSMQLASASYSEVKIWDAVSGQCLQTLNPDQDIFSMAFSHDSSKVAAVLKHGSFCVWNAVNGKYLLMREHSATPAEDPYCRIPIEFSPNSRMLTVANSSRLGIWDLDSGECLRLLEGHSDVITSVCFSKDSRWLASASKDSTIRIWDTHSGAWFSNLAAHTEVLSIAFFHYGTRLIWSTLDKVMIWNWSNGELVQFIDTGAVEIAVSPDLSKFVSTLPNSEVVDIWDMSTGVRLQSLRGHYLNVRSLSFSDDSQLLASASNDWSVKTWKLSGHQVPQEVGRRGLSIHKTALFVDSGQLAIAREDGSIDIWDVQNGKCLCVLEGHSRTIGSIIFSREEPRRLASVSINNTIKIWNSSHGECLQTLVSQQDEVQSIVFSRGATQLASISESGVAEVWDATTGECLQTLRCKQSRVSSVCDCQVAFSHDSELLATTMDDSVVRVWNISNSECIRTLRTPEPGSYTSIAFSNDSTRLASATEYLIMHIWDVSSGEHLHRFQCGDIVGRMSFDSTGLFLSTNTGEIDITASTRESVGVGVSEAQYRGFALEELGSWITYNSKKLLYLSSEYRPDFRRFEVLGNIVAIVDGSGRLWIYDFSPERL